MSVELWRPHLRAWDHLKQSGLSDAIIESAGIFPADDRYVPANSGYTGYVFPFYDPEGQPGGFWRTRILEDTADYKYYQEAGTGNYLYLPPQVPTEVWYDPSKALIAVEGEKKCLRAVQDDFYAFGVTGVDNWRRSKIQVPSSRVENRGKTSTIDLHGKSKPIDVSPTAVWLNEIVLAGRTVYLIYDTDRKFNPRVQDAAFEFAIWMFNHGAHVLQVELPKLPGKDKVGLDDFLAYYGSESRAALQELLDQPHWRFPYRSYVQKWINDQMYNTNKAERASNRAMSMAVIADLDRQGERYVDRESGRHFFLSRRGELGDKLYSFELGGKDLRGDTFGHLLIQRYHMLSHEQNLISAFADLYTTQAPIGNVRPRRLSYASDDGKSIYVQLTNSKHVEITAGNEFGQAFRVRDNGDGMMFYSDNMAPLDWPKVHAHLETLWGGPGTLDRDRTPHRWPNLLETIQVQPYGNLLLEETRLLLAAIFYTIPWLRGWRGIQLPVMQVLGEAGSGKTTLANFWRWMLSGSGSLDQVTSDERDFRTGIVNTPVGLWIGDNVNKLEKRIRDLINDEIARLVTDPDPHLKARLLYTTMQEGRFQVDCSFAVTSLATPFTSNDVIERSVMLHLDKYEQERNWGEWLNVNMVDREGWFAEHIYILQRLLTRIETEWDTQYRAAFRLRHYEQIIILLLQILHPVLDRKGATRIARAMQEAVQMEIRYADQTLDALAQFAEDWHQNHGAAPLTAVQIINWARGQYYEEFGELAAFQSPQALTRYIKQQVVTVDQLCGLRSFMRGGAQLYRALGPDERGRPRPGDDDGGASRGASERDPEHPAGASDN